MNRMSFRLAAIMVLCLFAFGCTKAAVGVVNTDRIYKDSVAGKAGLEYLESLSTELEAEIIELQKTAQSAKDQNAAQAEFQQALMGMQQRFASEQQQVVTKLNDAYQKAREAVMARAGLTMLLPSDVPLSNTPEADYTDQVIQEMDALGVTYTPL